MPFADARGAERTPAGELLQKTRFPFGHAGRTWEVDVYSGEKSGLVIAEIEIESEDAAVELPPLGRA